MSWHCTSPMRTAVFAVVLVATVSFGSSASAQKYRQTNLVSDVPGLAATLDPNCTHPPTEQGCALVNAWGIAFSSTSPVWVADNGSGKSTLYTGTGVPVPLVVTIPPPKGGAGSAAPTGIVFNSTDGFRVTESGQTAPSAFVFATEDGTISGWSPSVDVHNAILAVDNSGMGAVYKGLAIGTDGNATFIYATNFNSGWVEMYNSKFQWVKNFTDVEAPPGYAPFGIQNIGGKLYISFALQDEAKHDDVAGLGHGFVDVFTLSGNKIKRLVSGGQLDSPWGMALAPANFGAFSGDLLVGNFGNGHINAYNINTGAAKGRMLRPNGSALEVQGLWGLAFGNGAAAGPTNVLLFTAGPDHESHGLFGNIQAMQ